MSTTQTKFTKGPWKIDKYGNVKTPDGESLLVNGVALPAGNHTRQAEAEANAQLIAAAPALYEACQQAESALGRLKGQCDEREWAEDWQDLPDVLKQLSSALAAATGGKG